MLKKLQKFRQDLKKKGKGFTLVELIVVIIIIAVLAAVAIPSLVSFQDTARKARIQSEHRQLVQAVQSYIGSQTADVPDLDALKPYIAKESQGSGELSKTLAADNGKIAHEVNKMSHKLISTYTPASGGKPITWEFDWRSNSAS